MSTLEINYTKTKTSNQIKKNVSLIDLFLDAYQKTDLKKTRGGTIFVSIISFISPKFIHNLFER